MLDILPRIDKLVPVIAPTTFKLDDVVIFPRIDKLVPAIAPTTFKLDDVAIFPEDIKLLLATLPTTFKFEFIVEPDELIVANLLLPFSYIS